MTGEPGLEFGDHLGERAPGVVLKMPLRRDDVRHEPFELVPIVDQLGEQMAQIPVEQDAADDADHADRKSVVEGKSGAVRVDIGGGRRLIQKNKKTNTQ